MLKPILTYGIGVGTLLLIFKGAEQLYISKTIGIELYVSILALLFTSIGIWFGLKITRPSKIHDKASASMINTELLKAYGISERESEILLLVDQGKTNQEIGNELHISLSTVKSHLQNAYSKLDARNRTQALIAAKRISSSQPKV